MAEPDHKYITDLLWKKKIQITFSFQFVFNFSFKLLK